MYNGDFIDAFTYNLLTCIYITIIFGLAMLLDVLWANRKEALLVRYAWRICSAFACAMALSSALTITVILGSHHGRITGVSADEERFLLAHVRPRPVPLNYRHNKLGVASVIFMWLGTLATSASTAIMSRCLKNIERKDSISSSGNETEELSRHARGLQNHGERQTRAGALRRTLAEDAKELLSGGEKTQRVLDLGKTLAGKARIMAREGVRTMPHRGFQPKSNDNTSSNSKRRSQAIDLGRTLASDAMELISDATQKVHSVALGKKPLRNGMTDLPSSGAEEVSEERGKLSSKRSSQAIGITKRLAGDAKELLHSGVTKMQGHVPEEELNGIGSSSKRRSQAIDLGKALASDAKELLTAGLKKPQEQSTRDGPGGLALDWNGSLAGVRVSFSVHKKVRVGP